MLNHRLMWIAWPAFLMAGVTEMLVFVLIDPVELRWFGHPLEISRESVYTIAFFLFWIIIMISGALTTLLSISPFEVNRCPAPNKKITENCREKTNNNFDY